MGLHESARLPIRWVRVRPCLKCSRTAHTRCLCRAASFNHFVGSSALSIPALEPESGSFRLAIKDNIATTDFPTTCASNMLASYRSPMEATIVTQLRKRGAVVVGKTNMDEFGMGSHSVHSAFGPVINPASPSAPSAYISAGGSSGGSAVALKTSDADVALGTDTGGSVRMPAAYAGIIGYKPSYGMISRWGVVPYANSLDTVGLFASDVATIARLVFKTGLSQEHDPNDPTSLSAAFRLRQGRLRGEEHTTLTIGLPIEYNIAELDPLIKHAWIDAAARFAILGARVIPVSLPSTRLALSAYYVLAAAEASSNMAKYDGVRYGVGTELDDASNDSESEDAVLLALYAGRRGSGLGAEVCRRILLGNYTLGSSARDNYYLQAQRVRRLVQRDFDRVFTRSNPLHHDSNDSGNVPYDTGELPSNRQFNLSDIDSSVLMDSKLGPMQVDLLLCPTVPNFAPTLEEVRKQDPVDAYAVDVFTVPASLAGLPAISFPAPVAGGGTHLQAGMQLIGQFWSDELVLNQANKLWLSLWTNED